MAFISLWEASHRNLARPFAAGITIVVLAVPSVVVGCGDVHRTSARPPNTVTSPVLSTQPPALTSAARQAVGRVSFTTCDYRGSGSGFFIGPNTFITNRHVVEGATHVRIDLSGQAFAVQSIAIADHADLARLHTALSSEHTLTLATGTPRMGDHVRVIGFPRGGDITATEGRIVGHAKDSTEAAHALQTSAIIEPGNSGGPVIDNDGRVIGVASAIELQTGLAVVIPSAEVSLRTETWHSRELATCQALSARP